MENDIGGMGSEIYRQDATAFDNETGWDRVKMIFQRNMFEEISPELTMCNTVTVCGAFTGGTLGALINGQTAKEDWLRKNKETLFVHPYMAKRSLQDKMIVEVMKGGAKWGLKMGALSGAYCLITNSIIAYRNDGGFLEHIIAGTTAGAIFRINLGLRGMIAGGVVGLTLGTIAGTIMSASFYFTGTSVKEMRYWQHDYWNKYLKKQREIQASKKADNNNSNIVNNEPKTP